MTLLFAILAYFLGSIPFGKIAGLKHNIDIQKEGSGNIGFTNTLRVLGLKPALLVLIFDVLKGFAPVKTASYFVAQPNLETIAFLAILGHIFPLWLMFRGGKGIAVSLGVTLAISPILAIFGTVIFLMIVIITRIVSIASIIAVWTSAAAAYFLINNFFVFFLAIAILTTWTHRENIKRLKKGKERKLKIF